MLVTKGSGKVTTMKAFANNKTKSKRCLEQAWEGLGVEVWVGHTVRQSNKKDYAGNLPLCNKYNFHQIGKCAKKSSNCKRRGHQARDCRIPILKVKQSLKPRSQDTSLVALRQSAIKLARQKSYADVRRKPVEFQVDNRVMLKFVEEPVEIMDREVKRLRQSRVPIVKVRWNSRRGPEFTWKRKDQFRKKYPHLFTKNAPSSSAAS
ncbi:hypothetical protein Tco_0067458 [Tanacetum coccineum]